MVIDPMCGSGTTLEAAASSGRHFIGIDRSVDAAAIAHQRVYEVLIEA